MKRAISLLGTALMGMVILNGCGALNPINEDAADINFTTVTLNLEAGSGVNSSFAGKIDCSVAPAFTYDVLNASGTSAKANFTVALTNPTEKKADFTGTIQALAAATAGNYTFKVTATAGTANKFDTLSLVVTSAGTPVTVATVTLGSNNNAAAGSVDLDAMVIYKGAEAASKLADIDLCYAFSGTDNVDKLFSPAQAKASSFTFTSTWTGTPNSTKFYKLPGQSFDAITTVAQLEALWVEGSAQTASLAAVKNDVFIAKTNLNKIVLLLINDQTPGASGTIVLKSAK
jgi:hypothetical protein